MTLLLDTHLLLWAFLGSPDLPKAAIPLINDRENEVAFSVASLWEVAIKSGRRNDFQVNIGELRGRLLENGYLEVPISGTHVLALTGLPAIHKDPFDRILVAQAIAEGFTLLTSDAALRGYPVSMRLVQRNASSYPSL